MPRPADLLPRSVRRRARSAARAARATLRRWNRPRWGNLRRATPFSDRFGFDRGTPIDRHYLDRYFAAHAADITGRVLEIKEPAYTDRFGHDVSSVDIVDIEPRNPRVTVLADLAEAGSLPAETWDCVVVPQTLQYVDDPATAVANLWQAVRPGGVLLVTVPSLARRDPSASDIDRWRFLPAGLAVLLERGCPGGTVTMASYGSLVSDMGFLLGLAAEELGERDLDRTDERHPLLACGRVGKDGAP
jgi:SAM-dependent methyltransferase